MGWAAVNSVWVPPRKSIPRFRPLTAMESSESAISTDAIPNQMRRRPTMSIRCQRGISRAVAPMKAGLLNQRKPARRPRNARVAKTAVTIETAVPSRSMNAKPRTPELASTNRSSAVIAVTTFASMIVAKPFA